MPFLSRFVTGGVMLAAGAGLLAGGMPCAWAAKRHDKGHVKAEPPPASQAEARLIEVYRRVGQGQTRQALALAETLAKDHPNFQLAQLVYADLLTARTRAWRSLGEPPKAATPAGAEVMAELREESMLRLKALRERPPEGHVPAQFLRLSARNRHAIAVDTSRARLYLFEHTSAGLKLLADYYISVGKAGTGKSTEGDMRTPLGVYHVTSTLEPQKLRDFYGTGALPINYPNPYDQRRGKTGGGIWLHGTPPEQFARAPRASDGCIVLANPDLEQLMRTVEIRTTPVVIAHSLTWLQPQQALQPEVQAFTAAMATWRTARTSGDLNRLLSHYAADFSISGKTGERSLDALKSDLSRTRGRELELKDLSYLRWTDSADTMVVTFGEVPLGERTGPIKRQYWMRIGQQWKIFFEGVIG